MVSYKLVDENEEEVRYEYYPEGKLEKKGILVFDKNSRNVKEIVYSEEDYIVIHTVEEQNRLRNSLNEMRKESGRKLLTEEEWPTATEDMEYYLYASYAVDEISIKYHVRREFPREGRKIWY